MRPTLASIALCACLAPVPVGAESGAPTDGQSLAKRHCGRCHVVPGGDPFGGIGSTPSFRVLRSRDDWEVLFEGFYAEPPHRAVTLIDGLTDSFDPERPSPIAPMTMNEAEFRAILGFVATIAPRDVGRLE